MRIGEQDVDIEASRAPWRVDWTHEPAAEVAGVVRRRLRDVLTHWGVPEDVVDDALLVVTELIANVVDHAMTSFRLVVHLTGSVLRVAVADGSEELPVVRPFDPRARRGRGLQVIGSVARKWGCDQHEGGKVVWAELAV
jgi:anti-sigma regulatory factor (Ser/Thr protein kinase)